MQAAITAIRATGATQLILVEGTCTHSFLSHLFTKRYLSSLHRRMEYVLLARLITID